VRGLDAQVPNDRYEYADVCEIRTKSDTTRSLASTLPEGGTETRGDEREREGERTNHHSCPHRRIPTRTSPPSSQTDSPIRPSPHLPLPRPNPIHHPGPRRQSRQYRRFDPPRPRRTETKKPKKPEGKRVTCWRRGRTILMVREEG
jgi:hypothetical protein